MDFLNDCNAMVATCTILSIWNNTLLLRIYIYIFFFNAGKYILACACLYITIFIYVDEMEITEHYRNLYELHINL